MTPPGTIANLISYPGLLCIKRMCAAAQAPSHLRLDLTDALVRLTGLKCTAQDFDRGMILSAMSQSPA